MDPASLAFGVVSLALQLVETTSAIQELIATYKSASKELAALSDRLDDIETICHSLEVVLANSEDLPRPWEATLFKKLHKAIDDCRDRVSRVRDLISKILSRHHERRKPLNSVGTLFLKHRSQIRQCNDDLDQSLASLQLHMTTNILAMSMRPPEPPQKSICPATDSSEHNSQVDSLTASRQSRTAPLIQTRPEESVQHSKCGWNTVAYLEMTRKRRQVAGFGGRGCLATRDDVTVLAAVPLMSLYIKVSMRRGCLSPLSISIQFPHIINVGPEPDEIGDSLCNAMAENNLDAVKTLFSRGVLTPTTTATWGLSGDPDDTMSLIGLATVETAYSIFQLLEQHFPELSQREETNHMAHDNVHTISFEEPDVRCALAYINLRKRFLTPFELRLLLSNICDAGHAKACIDLCWTYSHKDWPPFNLCVWAWVAETFLDGSGPGRATKLTEELVPILTEANSRGLNIYDMAFPTSPSLIRQRRVLESILKLPDTEEIALETMHSWVDLLEQAGIDVQQYLDVEIEHIKPRWDGLMQSFCRSTSFQRSFVVRNSRGRRLPSFIETIDNSCPVRELFNEFPHLARRHFYGCVRGPLGVLEPRWARKNYLIKFYVETEDFPTWPVYPPFDRTLLWQYVCQEQGEGQMEVLDHACDLMESRFERRQMKKMRKAGLSMERRMPGAWVD